MNKFYINGVEISERQFKILNYLYDPLNHYCVVNEKQQSIEWGRVPKLIIRKKQQ